MERPSNCQESLAIKIAFVSVKSAADFAITDAILIAGCSQSTPKLARNRQKSPAIKIAAVSVKSAADFAITDAILIAGWQSQ